MDLNSLNIWSENWRWFLKFGEIFQMKLLSVGIDLVFFLITFCNYKNYWECVKRFYEENFPTRWVLLTELTFLRITLLIIGTEGKNDTRKG